MSESCRTAPNVLFPCTACLSVALHAAAVPFNMSCPWERPSMVTAPAVTSWSCYKSADKSAKKPAATPTETTADMTMA